MQPITPHYTALGLLKVPDIVKLNTCLLLYDYSNADKRSNFNLSLVSKLHDYDSRSVSSNHLANTSFRQIVGKFCLTIVGRYIWNDIPHPIREKPTKQMF